LEICPVRPPVCSTAAPAAQEFSELERQLGLDSHIVLMKFQRFHHDDIHWTFWIGDEPVLTVNSETLLDNDKLRQRWKLATGEFPYL
jgi:hypothetical protein